MKIDIRGYFFNIKLHQIEEDCKLKLTKISLYVNHLRLIQF